MKNLATSALVFVLSACALALPALTFTLEDRSTYHVVEELEGTFQATVYKVQDAAGQIFALKIMDRTAAWATEGEAQYFEIYKSLNPSARALLAEPHYFGTVHSNLRRNPETEPRKGTLMDFAGTDLERQSSRYFIPGNEKNAVARIRRINRVARALLQFLTDIAHEKLLFNDLKPRNVATLGDPDHPDWKLRIIDGGSFFSGYFPVSYYRNLPNSARRPYGTQSYNSPEQERFFDGSSPGEIILGPLSDFSNLGMLVSDLAFRKGPLYEFNTLWAKLESQNEFRRDSSAYGELLFFRDLVNLAFVVGPTERQKAIEASPLFGQVLGFEPYPDQPEVGRPYLKLNARQQEQFYRSAAARELIQSKKLSYWGICREKLRRWNPIKKSISR